MPAQPREKEAAAEEVRLDLLPGSGEEQNNRNHAISGRDAASFCSDRNHRKLAVCSVICGLSCIGCKALVYSVKVLQSAFSWRNPSFQACFEAFMHPSIGSTGGRGDGSAASGGVFTASQKVRHHRHPVVVVAPGFHPRPDGADLVSSHSAGLNWPPLDVSHWMFNRKTMGGKQD